MSLRSTEEVIYTPEENITLSKEPSMVESETGSPKQLKSTRRDSEDVPHRRSTSSQVAGPWLNGVENQTTSKTRPRLSLDTSRFQYRCPSSQIQETRPLSRHSRRRRSSSVSALSKSPSASSMVSISSCNSLRRSLESVLPMGSRPQVPKIPEKYRNQAAQDICNEGKPTRPESKPSMPPAAFWKYVAEQQAQGTSPGMLQSWQLKGDQRRGEPKNSYPAMRTLPGSVATRKERMNQPSAKTGRKDSFETCTADVACLSDNAGMSSPVHIGVSHGDPGKGTGR